jgi:uncharacterized protein (TIGR03905 family)
MIKNHWYTPFSNVCSQRIVVSVEVETNRILEVQIDGGYNGFKEGLCRLLVGRDVDEVIALLENVPCKGHDSSCPAEVAKALKVWKSIHKVTSIT